MGKKIIRFTDKASGESREMLSGSLGHNVFDVTKNVNQMNSAVRWCNSHGVGDVLDDEKYKIEIIGGV